MRPLTKVKIKTWDELLKSGGIYRESEDVIEFEDSCFVSSMKLFCGRVIDVVLQRRGVFDYRGWRFSRGMYDILEQDINPIVDLICQEIDVEIDEKWIGNDGEEYCIDKEGVLKLNRDSAILEKDDIGRVISGELKPAQKKPEVGERYFVPAIFERSLVYAHIWSGDEYDTESFKKGLVFDNVVDAENMAITMLSHVKDIRKRWVGECN